MSDPTAYLLERAWVDGAVHDGVRVEIEDGRFIRRPSWPIPTLMGGCIGQ